MSTIFDSHCHPQMAQYDKDRDAVIKRTLDAGVNMICVGTDLESSKQGIELAQRHDGIWATVGIHPNDAESIKGQVLSIKEYEERLEDKKVVAVGEIGLDYYRTPEKDKQENQKKVFIQLLELAIKYNKPIIIHSRDASKGSSGRVHSDMLDILNTRYLIHNTNRGGVAHSFTGSIDDAKEYLNRGMYLGFNGIITFARQYDEVVKYAPLEQILLETDAPFLTPEPYRGQRNEPAYVLEVAKKIAEIKNIEVNEVIEKTTKNCENLFKI